MAEDIQYMDVNEFRELGILQELNRQFLHPLGLALEVVIDDETGEAIGFGGVWDYRDDPEGIRYGDIDLVPKAIRFSAFQERAHERRRETLGYIVQPIPDGGADE